jgi:hypothetical protein
VKAGLPLRWSCVVVSRRVMSCHGVSCHGAVAWCRVLRHRCNETDGNLVSVASLWLSQHAISDPGGNGNLATDWIQFIYDGTNPQAVISVTLPRYVSKPVLAATRCVPFFAYCSLLVALLCAVAHRCNAAVARSF